MLQGGISRSNQIRRMRSARQLSQMRLLCGPILWTTVCFPYPCLFFKALQFYTNRVTSNSFGFFPLQGTCFACIDSTQLYSLLVLGCSFSSANSNPSTQLAFKTTLWKIVVTILTQLYIQSMCNRHEQEQQWIIWRGLCF